MWQDNLLLFITVTMIISASPGPAMIASLHNGVRFGIKGSWTGIAGLCIGNLLLIAISGLGAAALLAKHPFVFQVMQWLGTAWLIYLGIHAIKAPLPEFGRMHYQSQPGGWSLFHRNFVLAISNPKGLIYVGAFFPQFLNLTTPLWPQYLGLSSVFLLIDILWLLIYTSAGRSLVSYLHSDLRKRLFNWLCGLALIGCGLMLLISRL